MLRVDLHLHSNYSHDGRSTLQQLIDRAIECGLDRIALTDHNVFEGAESLRRLAPALAIGGEEIKTLEGEDIGLFITRAELRFLGIEVVIDLTTVLSGLNIIHYT